MIPTPQPTKAQRQEAKRLKWLEAQEARHIAKYGPKKVGAFTNVKLKKSLQFQVESEKNSILKPRMRWLRSVGPSLEPIRLLMEIESYLTLSNTISCKMKPSYTMEEAAVADQFSNDTPLSPYICKSCGFVHFGHDPIVLSIAPQTVNFQEVAA